MYPPVEVEPTLEKAVRPLRRRVVAVSLGLVGVAGAGVFVLSRPPAATPAATPAVARPVPISVRFVERQPFSRSLSLSGTVAAWDELPVGAELTGLRIEQIFVDEGDRVRRGQELARLNDRPLRAQLRQVEAEILRTRALVAQQQSGLAEAQAVRIEAEANRERFANLEREGAVSALEAQSRRTGSDTAAARTSAALGAIAVAQGDLERAIARREELLATLAQTRLVAPTDGVVSRRQAKLGAVVSPVAAQALFTLVRDGRLELKAQMSEVHLGAIRPGQQATVTSDAHPGRTFAARVREIAPVVDERERDALVRIDLPRDSTLRPGMFARAQVQTASGPALVVPEGAVLYKDERPFVFVVAGTTARRRPIRTGERRGGLVEVHFGLKAGEQVAVAGAGYLEDGAQVRWAEVGP